jgi:hypothetical protein
VQFVVGHVPDHCEQGIGEQRLGVHRAQCATGVWHPAAMNCAVDGWHT